ncbi:TPM domain-containing protein [Blattabacterium cuenoti]|uniref:TPM domain-containing protein n=1 Tax=Blattabacterium cuenoti TaxID=1653831 RepID=UPI00163C0138|nr:TPM domain-containing protein [Blattabacterium cuenoti]
MKKILKKIIKFLLILLIFTNLVQGQQLNIPDKPKKIYPVNDYAGVLSHIQIQKLNEKLIQYSKKTSTEILISIVRDLYGEDPNFLASKWGNKWHIGKKYKNNGIIILLSMNDKKISIQNGYGIEPYLTDFTTRRIIQKIKPLLKKNLYYEAIDISIKEIFKIMKNEYINKENKKNHFYKWNLAFSTSVFLIIFFFIFLCKKGIAPSSSSLNILLLTNILFKKKYSDNEDSFDGFGEGGNFGGGGSCENW